MATTTTNFGWDIPQSTDLVKDGATAIAALGQDIDTALVDLKGGTTGQILAKASNTDLDYSWVTNDVGDITEVTAGTGLTGGGTSGAVSLAFDQANFGGGQYAAGKNKIINGDFGINQRAFTTTTTTGTYGFDRWVAQLSGGTATYSAQTFTPGAAPVAGYEATNFARLATTVGNDFCTLRNRIEDVRTFAGQTVTLSFWAKGTNPTTLGGLYPTITQNFGSGGSTAVVLESATKIVLTANWTRYSITFAIASISGKTIGTSSFVDVALGQGTNASTDAWTLDLWGVQLEAGSTASPFQTATGTIQGELAACQRYYVRYGGEVAYNTVGNGYATSTTNSFFNINLPVQMRVIPTAVDFSTMAIWGSGFGVTALTNLVLPGENGSKTVRLTGTSASGLTANNPAVLVTNNSTSGYVGFSAEL